MSRRACIWGVTCSFLVVWCGLAQAQDPEPTGESHNVVIAVQDAQQNALPNSEVHILAEDGLVIKPVPTGTGLSEVLILSSKMTLVVQHPLFGEMTTEVIFPPDQEDVTVVVEMGKAGLTVKVGHGFEAASSSNVLTAGGAVQPRSARSGGEDCASATVIGGLPFSDSGSTAGAADDYDEACPFTGGTAPDHVYSFSPAADVTVDISLCGNSDYDTKLYVYENSCPGTVTGCNDDSCTTPSFGSPFVSELTGLALTGGNTYFIVVDGFGTNSGNYTIDISEVGGTCTVTCPAGSGQEAEACGSDTNGGCNTEPPDPPVFESINCGDTVCGTSFFDGTTRDTDWYELVVPNDAIITISLDAEFESLFGLVGQAIPGAPGCDNTTGLIDPAGFGLPCEPESVVTACLPAGTYYVFVAPVFTAGNVLCPADYVLSVTCDGCTATRGACCTAGVCDDTLTQDQCEGADGTYQGDDTSCPNVTCPQPGVNDDCADAIGPLAVPSVTQGTTELSEIDSGFPFCGTGITSPGVWYTVIGTGNGMTASTCEELGGSAAYDSKVSVYCQDCDGGLCVAGNDDDPVNPCGDFPDFHSTVTWCSQVGAEYLILVHGFGGQEGPFDLFLSDDGAACAGAVGCLPEGGCCLPDASCVVIDEGGCLARGGSYQGDDTDCSGATGGGGGLNFAADPNLAIPDGSGVFISHTINVPDDITLGDVNVDLRITHTWVGDLIVEVEHNGTTVRLWDRDCSFRNDIDVIFDDQGNPLVCAEPTVGNVIPTEALSAFNGMSSAGDWTISVSDNVSFDSGTLDHWSLELSSGTAPSPGGCCGSDASCVVTTQTCCEAAGGSFQGFGTDCSGAGPGGGGLNFEADPNLAIPDGTGVFVSDTINVPDDIILGDVNVDLQITHTWINDLIVEVEHNGTTVRLWDRDCFSEDDIDVIFDDQGNPLVCAEPTVGNVIPTEALSAFNGMSSAGDWTISVSDNVSFDSGTLDHWSLELSSGAAPSPGACCGSDGSCVVTTQTCCEDAGGVFQGFGAQCPGPSGEYPLDSCGNAFEDISGTGTVAPEASDSDDDGDVVPIGFTFNFFGDDHDTIGITSNGYLTFGSDLTDFSNDQIPNSIDPDDLITAYWDDYDPVPDDPSDPDGVVQYETRGIAPNRWFIGQWTDMREFFDDNSNTFQAILFEGSNCIEFRYGLIDPEGFGGDVTVGIENQDGSDGVNVGASNVSEGDCVLLCPEIIPDPCPIIADLDIKPGSCPNSFNRRSHGVLPVGLLGSANLDVSMVDVTTLKISRSDGVGGSVGPNEGPPGPHTVTDDVGTPFGGELCDCHTLTGDGIMDLSMKFRTNEVVAALELDSLAPGSLVELTVSGNLLTGKAFIASDCIRLVPQGSHGPATLIVDSNLPEAWIQITPFDQMFDSGGFSQFDRTYPDGTAVTFAAEEYYLGQRFIGWKVNGEFVSGDMSAGVTTQTDVQAIDAVFRRTGDMNGDESVNLNDFAMFAVCFGQSWGNNAASGCSNEALAASDLDRDGMVNLTDFAIFAMNFGG